MSHPLLTRGQPTMLGEVYDNVLGQALMAGRLVATMESKLTGSCIGIEIVFKARNPSSGRWRIVPFHEASVGFVDVAKSPDKIGTVRAGNGWDFDPAPRADPARVWAALVLMRIAMGLDPIESERYRVQQMTHCFRCGAELTEPESIEKGLGPTCAGHISRVYGLRHQVKRSSPRQRTPRRAHREDPDRLPNGGQATLLEGSDLRTALGL